MILRNVDKRYVFSLLEKQLVYYSTNAETSKEIGRDDFKPLNLKHVKGQIAPRKQIKKVDTYPPRTKQMAVDQDWGNVWPGAKTFHPASVPLSLRQGYVEKGAPPDKYANAELMKIPNFLHLTPPVIKRQCEVLKKFCTPWPKKLDSDEKCLLHFPTEVTTSSYCHSAPTIRNPLARIVTVKIKVSTLNFHKNAKDKFMRLVGERYDEETDTLTIVADRCPLSKQNYDYAMYLVTALYHESMKTEPWESLKSEADMEYYDWNNNASKKAIEKLFDKPANEIQHSESYSNAVSNLMNEGENDYTLVKYGEAVRQILNLSNRQ